MTSQQRRTALVATGIMMLLMCLVTLIPALSSARSRKSIIRETMPAVAMILAVDLRDGRLVPVSSGSGTIIDANGSVLTNHHVLFDAKNNKLHDLFIVGLFRAADKEPELVCVGDPSKGLLKAKLDLALIRCDRDRAGAPWQPSAWPTISLRQMDTDAIVPGEQVWVLGYPGVGGSTIHVTAGLISGFTGEEGETGFRAFLKTDASITHGNSGGTAIDEDGNFIGVPTAFRLTTTKQGGEVVAAGRVGLIRSLDHAGDLISAARITGGTSPTPAAKAGVVITSRVQDGTTGKPIEGAVVIIFKPGIAAKEVNLDKLDEQALVWTQTDGAGVFRTPSAISKAQRYTVAVAAEGYLPLLESGVLSIPESATPEMDPWQNISLQPESK
ncbi:MAG: trypsin-like serine protease [Myxococcales bacterium]|nr:trypsin-like serine protease [Myxococcales bacterium]